MEKQCQLIYYYSVKLFFALIKNKTQTAVINILNLHIVLKLDVLYVLYIRLNQNVQVQYVYHCWPKNKSIFCFVYRGTSKSPEAVAFIFQGQCCQVQF